MKITFFIGSMQRGGAERVISILAEDYRSRGWDVDIVLLLHDIMEYDLHEQINVIRFVGKNKSYIKNAIYWFKNIRRYLRVRRPDRVVSFIGRINALVLTTAIGLRLPIVVSERNDPKHDGRSAAMQWYCNKIYRLAKSIVYQNEHEKSCFDKVLDSRGYIIPNPVSVTATRHERARPIVATAGRLVEQKNHAMLVSSMKKVKEAFPEAICEVYGDGVLQEQIEGQIAELDLEETVLLKGCVTDLHERLSDCAVFVMTSNFEGLSNALIEAMMIGLPCITTDYPGARELIQDGENGMVVPMNDIEALTKAIEKLLANENGYADRLAENAKQSAENFRAEYVLKQWREVIEG